MGQPAYGISASTGEVHYTLRTWTEEGMQQLKTAIHELLTRICQRHLLQFTTDWFDYFPSTINNDFCNQLVCEAAQTNGFTLKMKPTPFKFGEDFGWFSQRYPCAMFGVGAGIDRPALHHADYDFPDELLETGIAMFRTIIAQLLGNE